MTHFYEGILNYSNFLEWGMVSGLIPQCILKWKNKKKKNNTKKESDSVHVSMNKREEAQWKKTTEDGEKEGQGQENEDWVWHDGAKNSKKEH